MNEVHWSDPEFQKWEEQQLGDYKEDTYHSVTGDLMKHFRHEYPDGYYHRPGASINYARVMLSIKEEFTDFDAASPTDEDYLVTTVEEVIR